MARSELIVPGSNASIMLACVMVWKGRCMMPSILVRGLDKKIVERLKEKAKRNGRSLQSEAKQALEEAAGRATWEEVRDGFAKWQQKLQGSRLPSVVEMIREDRQR